MKILVIGLASFFKRDVYGKVPQNLHESGKG
jgi:hypothetical protein